jgi:hypothetical protein
MWFSKPMFFNVMPDFDRYETDMAMDIIRKIIANIRGLIIWSGDSFMDCD